MRKPARLRQAFRGQQHQDGTNLRGKALDELRHGDLGGFFGTFWQGFSERAGVASGGAPSGGQGAVSSPHVEAFFRAHGYSAEQAKGIAAGISAEGGGLGMSKNGAFGLGQWRGSRQRGLFARYGHAPSSDQQLEYLLWELRGGDRGGASVAAGTTWEDTGFRYLRDLMRPQGARGEHMRDLVADVSRMRAYGRARSGSAGGNTTNINGSIVIHTAASDAPGIARSIGPELAKRGLVVQAQSGMTP